MEKENYGPIDQVNIIEEMIGKTFRMVTNVDDEELHFISDDGYDYIFYHDQDCCESVAIEDIAGNLEDLEGSPITMAEETIHESQYEDEWGMSSTYTFYKFATAKGYVTVRWFGESNGYYSESVNFTIQRLRAN